MWIDASYQYIVVPNVSEQQMTAAGSNNRYIEIIANTSDLQAVKHRKFEIIQLAFYKNGEVEIAKDSKVKMDIQGMAMLKMQSDQLKN